MKSPDCHCEAKYQFRCKKEALRAIKFESVF